MTDIMLEGSVKNVKSRVILFIRKRKDRQTKNELCSSSGNTCTLTFIFPDTNSIVCFVVDVGFSFSVL